MSQKGMSFQNSHRLALSFLTLLLAPCFVFLPRHPPFPDFVAFSLPLDSPTLHRFRISSWGSIRVACCVLPHPPNIVLSNDDNAESTSVIGDI